MSLSRRSGSARGARLCQAALSLCLMLSVAAEALAACVDDGQRAQLNALKAQDPPLPPADERMAMALRLVDCLADPDPELRDGMAYTLLSAWMRAEAFDADALRELRAGLLAQLERDDPAGFARPFAALVLAELARTDRISPWMQADERAALVELATAYLRGVDDYRGLIAGEGWRHGVAHGADWILQLSLNPHLERAQLESLRDAVGSQVLAADGHAYVFNEPARLAAPLLFIARRGVFDAEQWQAWLAEFPGRVGPAEAVWASPQALAARHNLLGLLLTLHFEVIRSEDAGIRALLPGVEAALRALP